MTTEKTTYTATFSDGETKTRKTDRSYTHAWRSSYTSPTSGLVFVKIGFASDLANAEKAASGFIPKEWEGSYEVVEATRTK